MQHLGTFPSRTREMPIRNLMDRSRIFIGAVILALMIHGAGCISELQAHHDDASSVHLAIT